MLALRAIYVANILVTTWISVSCLFYPRKAQYPIFSGDFAYSESIRLVGALWGAVLVLSVIGLFFPKPMSLVLLFQLIYKLTWILLAAFPAMLQNQPYPKAMTVFFVLWIIILPFVIPWKYIFH
jgi:hypothetical protein